MHREEFVARGQDYYDRFLRDKLEPEHNGEYLVLTIQTGEYEMDFDEIAALERAERRMPGVLFHILRVGYPAADRAGDWRPRGRL
jgi:hypothetical protein